MPNWRTGTSTTKNNLNFLIPFPYRCKDSSALLLAPVRKRDCHLFPQGGKYSAFTNQIKNNKKIWTQSVQNVTSRVTSPAMFSKQRDG